MPGAATAGPDRARMMVTGWGIQVAPMVYSLTLRRVAAPNGDASSQPEGTKHLRNSSNNQSLLNYTLHTP